MRPSIALKIHRQQIKRIVEKHHALRPKVFGSVLRGDDTDQSDLDLLIEPTNETTLMDIGAIRYQLHELLGVPVDVLTPNGLPDNYRTQILEEAKLI